MAECAQHPGRNEFLDRLEDIGLSLDEPDEPLFAWGHQPI
jgi:hypothetical protein